MGWSSAAVGTFLAIWIVGYSGSGFTPRITGSYVGRTPDGLSATYWGLVLAMTTGRSLLGLVL